MNIEKSIEELSGKFTYALLSSNGANEIRLKQTIGTPKNMKMFDSLYAAVFDIVKNNFNRNGLTHDVYPDGATHILNDGGYIKVEGRRVMLWNSLSVWSVPLCDEAALDIFLTKEPSLITPTNKP